MPREAALRPAPPPGLRLFLWVRWHSWRAALRELVRAPIKLIVIVGAWSLLIIGLYALCVRGIRFIHDTVGLGSFLMSRLWVLFLFVVMILLAVSQLTSAYSTLVRSSEIRHWMTMPISARGLGRMKWLESSFYSAWAVALLVLPLCAANLRVMHKPWWLMGFFVSVVLVPLIGIVTALATVALFAWLRWIGPLVIRRELFPVGFVIACSGLFWVLGERSEAQQQDAWFLALQDLLPRMRIAMAGWLPSRWAAATLDAAMEESWTEVGLYVGLLWTTMLVSWRVLDHVAARLFFPVLRQHGQSAGVISGTVFGGRAEGTAGKGRALSIGPAWWMRHPLLASLAKDVFLILRDPLQWSQGVMFFGLLGAYFANIQHLARISPELSWRLGVSSLNLACTLLVFGSLSVRFVFPQMSLEGRRLWLVCMAPGGTRRMVLAKVLLYAALAIGLVEGLLALSVGQLHVPNFVGWWLAAIGVIASLALVGLSVGCGAWWMDPTAEDAARLVSSSAGALVLVLMLAYVGCVVAALVVTWTSWMAGSWRGFIAAGVGLAVISAMVGLIPLHFGLLRLNRLEDTP